MKQEKAAKFAEGTKSSWPYWYQGEEGGLYHHRVVGPAFTQNSNCSIFIWYVNKTRIHKEEVIHVPTSDQT